MLERYGLSFNPFPRGEAEQYRGDPDRLDIILFDAEKEKLRSFAKELDKTVASFAVVGPWGTGKSLFLIYFYKLLRNMYGADKVYFVYVKAPSNVEDMLTRICSELKIPIPKKFSYNDVVEAIRQRVKELVESGYIVYIAVDQLEETYRNIMQLEERLVPNLVAQLVETIRGKLSAMVDKRYALGIAVIDTVWQELTTRWQSLAGIDTLRLRTLEQEEIGIFVMRYLEKARSQEIIKEQGLEEVVRNNPLHPFTDDAIAELYKMSRGVQRNICSWAYDLLEKSKDKFDKIDSFVIRLLIDKKAYLRQRVVEEILPYHPMRVPMVVREVLSYIGLQHGSKYGIMWIGPIDKNTFLLNVKGKNTALFCIAKQHIDLDDIEPLLRYLQEGAAIGNEKVSIDNAIMLQVVSRQGVSYSKLIGTQANLQLAKFSARLRHKILDKDSLEEWGRLTAFYLYIKRELMGYITSDSDEDAEVREIIKLVGLL